MATYTDPTLNGVTTNIARDVAPDITILTREYPAMTMAMAKRTRAISTVIEWHDTALRASFLTTASDETGTSGDTSLRVTGNHTASWVRVNMIFRPQGKDELIRVTAIGSYDSTTATTALTVERGFGYTSATELTVSKRLDLAATSALEGAAFAATITSNLANRTNRTHIYREGWSVTGSELAVMGVNGLNAPAYAEKEMLAMKTVARDFAKAIWLSSKQSSSPQGTASAVRTMDGYAGQVQAGSALGTNVHYLSLASADFDSTDATDNLQALCKIIVEYGGSPTHCFVNSGIWAQIVKDGAAVVTSTNGEVGVLYRTVEAFVGIGGRVQIIMDPSLPADCIAVTNMNDWEIKELRPFAVIEMAVVGDSRDYLLIGEYSLIVRNAARGGHVWGYAAVATAALP